MKRLSAVLVALVMLGICTSSYGYFLIYNLSGTIKGTDGTVDVKKVTIAFKGFLVMNFDNDTNSLVDANMLIYGIDPNGHMVHVQLNAHDSNDFLDVYILTEGVRNFYGINGNSPFGFSSLIMGDVHRTNIGSGLSKYIATALSGPITGEEGILLGLEQDIAGAGNMSATLYSLATRAVNSPHNHIAPHTQDGIINVLKVMLKERGYNRAVSIPSPT